MTLVNASSVNARSVKTAIGGSVVTKSGKVFPHSAQIEAPCSAVLAAVAVLAILGPNNGNKESDLGLALHLSIWFAFCFQVSIDRLKDTRSAVFRRKYDGELTLT